MVEVREKMLKARNVAVALEEIGIQKKGRTILKDISLEVYEGEVFALLGLEGSGKTNLLKAIMGLNQITEGIKSVSSQLGYVSETRALYDRMTVSEIEALCKGLSQEWNQSLFSELLNKIMIDGKSIVGSLSKSKKSLLYIILTLATNPRILLIDEPMEGLDDLTKETLMSLLLSFMEDGKNSLILASRTIVEIAGIIDRFGVLNKGKLIYNGSVDDAIANYCRVRIVPKKLDVEIPNLNGIYGLERDGRSILVRINQDKEEIIDYLRKIPHDFFDVIPLGINDVYKEMLREEMYL